MKDKIHIANLLLTRRCNLNCSYCGIIRDPKNSEYDSIRKINSNELPLDGWLDIIYRLHANNPNIFLILYGGEPTLKSELDEIISYCNFLNISYTIVTNNTNFAFQKLLKISNDVEIKGITSSVDPVLLSTEQTDEIAKSKSGLMNLTEFKDKEVAKDLVAEITVTSKTLPYLYDTVKTLSENGIYSSITFIDPRKNQYYDFSNIDSSQVNDLVYNGPKVQEQIYNITTNKDFLVHIPNMVKDLPSYLPANMYCDIYKNIHNVTIDADGKFRLCLRIRGPNLQNYKYFNIIKPHGKFYRSAKKLFKKDYKKCCDGCNWTCMLMSGKYFKSIIDH